MNDKVPKHFTGINNFKEKNHDSKWATWPLQDKSKHAK